MHSNDKRTEAKQFECVAKISDATAGVSSNPFLNNAFRTTEYRIIVTFLDDGAWSYEQDTVMQIHGQDTPFHHLDTHVLTKVGDPTPNPLSLEAKKPPSRMALVTLLVTRACIAINPCNTY